MVGYSDKGEEREGGRKGAFGALWRWCGTRLKVANRKRGEGLPRDVEEMRIREIDRTKQKKKNLQ